MKLIDADQLEDVVTKANEQGFDVTRYEFKRIELVLSEFPTVDAEPVRHGHWEDKYGDGDWHCSICGAIVEKDEQKRHNWYRCYHCGAKMDEVEE